MKNVVLFEIIEIRMFYKKKLKITIHKDTLKCI